MGTLLPDIPMNSSVLQVGLDGKSADTLSGDYYQYLFGLAGRIQTTPQVIPPSVVTGSAVSIGATPLHAAAFGAGYYRVSYYARITQAASVSSSLTVTIGWIDGGVPQTLSGAAITGNTPTTVQSGSAGLIHADSGLGITFSTTYVSVGGTPMQYALNVIAEQVA